MSSVTRPPQHLLEVPHAVDRALDDRDVRAEAERDDGRVVADDAAADDDDLPGRDARHAAEQQAAAAERLLEEVRAGLGGEPAGDLAHRREQRQRPVARLDRLVRDRRDPALDERVRQPVVRGEVQVREEDEPVAEPAVLGVDRLLDLEQQLGVAPDVVDRDDLRADRLVRVVGECAALARALLDEDVVARVARARARRPGVSATRYSSDLISLATPIFIASRATLPSTLSAHSRCRHVVIFARYGSNRWVARGRPPGVMSRRVRSARAARRACARRGRARAACRRPRSRARAPGRASPGSRRRPARPRAPT